MFKKMISIGFAAILLFSFAACNLSKENDTYTLLETDMCCCPQIEQTSLYWNNIALSAAAYEEAITYFTTEGEKRTDDFGGVFIDENGLYNICVVGNRKPVASDYLIYRQVENSYNFLYSVYEAVGEVMQEYSVWSVSTCESCNSVLICLEDENKISSLIKYLKTNNLLRKGALNIFVGENQIMYDRNITEK